MSKNPEDENIEYAEFLDRLRKFISDKTGTESIRAQAKKLELNYAKMHGYLKGIRSLPIAFLFELNQLIGPLDFNHLLLGTSPKVNDQKIDILKMRIEDTLQEIEKLRNSD